MKQAVLLRASLCALFMFSAGAVAARQGDTNVAVVSGWRTEAAEVAVYGADGAKKAMANLRDELQPGLLRWNPEYDLVKLTRNANDDRWVRARELKVTYCEKPLVPKVVPGGGNGQTRALSMGSGAGCP